MPVHPDLKELLPPRPEDDDRPVYYLWTFDPQDGHVYLDHNEEKHPAHHVTHDDLAPQVTHPETVHGYAYSIKDGWRITNDERDEVDPYIARRVLKALKGEHPEPPLPHIRYHGAP